MSLNKPYIKSVGWAILGFIVSISIIKTGRFSLFGYPLLVLSILMVLLSIKLFYKEIKKS